MVRRSLTQDTRHSQESLAWVNFDSAAGTYHSASTVQTIMAETLLDLFPLDVSPVDILELGCGTGHLTLKLLQKFPHSNLNITDIAPNMLAECKERTAKQAPIANLKFYLQDAEKPLKPFTPSKMSLVTSNAMIQWMAKPALHFKRVHQSLATEGYYLFSGFHPHNFSELKGLLKEFNLIDQKPFGMTRDGIDSLLSSSGFRTVIFSQAKWVKQYTSLLAFLKTLKQSGANRFQSKVPLISEMKQLEKTYQERFAQGNGVAVSWQPWFCLAKKQ